jgi:hypothetical protein
MNKKTTLQIQAIQAVKNNEWEKAVNYNQAILDLDNLDISAHNRLGVAYLQLAEKKKAKDIFQKVLEIDKSNAIARKHLYRLSHNQNVTIPTFSTDQFIEEPGKTRTVDLHRLASKNILNDIIVGSEATLIPKSRYISIEVKGVYIGALPEDLSFRLTKLITTGNEYSCRVRSVNGCGCAVFLREVKRSKPNEHTNSFPLSKTQLATINDIDDIFLEDDIPVQVVETDNDVEKTLESNVLESIEE